MFLSPLSGFTLLICHLRQSITPDVDIDMGTQKFTLQYIGIYIQPLAGLFIGLAVLAFVGYINWYGTVKADTIRWIAKCIFRDEFRSEVSADGLFMAATGFMLLIGGLWIILAVQYLGY